MTSNNRMLRSALWYARHGWHVFPIHAPLFTPEGECFACTCESWRRTDDCKQYKKHMYLEPGQHCVQPGKCPACRWAEKSTIDIDTIYKWWGHDWRTTLENGVTIYYTPNIGIDCGKSDLLVFDADAYKDVYPDDDLLSRGDKETITALTGGGGEHLVYARIGLPFGNSCKGLPKGIDIRGAGGYIVAAPSVHKSGRRYQWEIGYGPHEIDPAPIPDTLQKILSQSVRRPDGDPLGPADAEAVRKSVELVEKVLEAADIAHHNQQEYGQGRRWILETCPFMDEDDPHADDNGTFVIVLEDGHIAAGCHHNRCQHIIAEAGLSGWEIIKQKTVTIEAPKEAKYPRVYRPAKAAA